MRQPCISSAARRERRGTFAAAAHEIASEHSFPLLLTWSKCLLGWSMAELGEASAGLAVLREGLRIAEATGSEVYKPHWLGLLASAQARNGLIDEARRSIDEALEVRDRQGERFYLAELYRLRGELRLASDGDAGSYRLADADFGRALEIADSQGARQLFLRAAISRARLWCSLGKNADARALLNRACGGIAEGRELPDALEASAVTRRVD